MIINCKCEVWIDFLGMLQFRAEDENGKCINDLILAGLDSVVCGYDEFYDTAMDVIKNDKKDVKIIVLCTDHAIEMEIIPLK